MPRRLASLLLLALATCCAPLHAQALRVMSFNVRTLSANDGANAWEHRRDLAARVVREAHPDVMGTQELHSSQGNDLLARLPGYAWFGIGRRGGDGDEHMGVFYRTERLKVLDSGNYWLSDTPDVPGSQTWGNPYPRMVTWAIFEDLENHRSFLYANTHFPYLPDADEARAKSAREILTRLAALPEGTPVILTGDFNTESNSPAHRLLTAQLTDTREAIAHPQGPEKTFHDFTGTPTLRLDWILERGFAAKSFATITTHEGRLYPSDHFPVLGVLAWPETP